MLENEFDEVCPDHLKRILLQAVSVVVEQVLAEIEQGGVDDPLLRVEQKIALLRRDWGTDQVVH